MKCRIQGLNKFLKEKKLSLQPILLETFSVSKHYTKIISVCNSVNDFMDKLIRQIKPVNLKQSQLYIPPT